MNFAFIDDPQWSELDPAVQRQVIDLSFEKNITSDPAWQEVSIDEQQAVKDLYTQKAQEYSQSKEPKAKGILGAVSGGTERALDSVRTAWNVATGDEEEAREITEKTNRIPKTPEQQGFMSSLQARKEANGDDSIWQGVKNVAGAAWENPMGAFHEVMAQLPNSAVVLGSMAAGAKTGGLVGTATPVPGGAAVGAISGGIIGLLFGNTAIETGGIAQEQINQGEYDRSEALAKGFKKGGVITGVDVATMGATKMMFAPAFRAAEKASQDAISGVLKSAGVNPFDDIAVKTAISESPELMRAVRQAGARAATEAAPKGLKNVGLHSTAMSLDMIGEGTGEYVGSVVAGLDASLTDAVMESLMSVPQSAGEVAIGKSLAKGRGILTRDIPNADGEDGSPDLNIANAETVDEALDAFQQDILTTPVEQYSDAIPFPEQPGIDSVIERQPTYERQVQDFENDLQQANADIGTYQHEEVTPENTPDAAEIIARQAGVEQNIAPEPSAPDHIKEIVRKMREGTATQEEIDLFQNYAPTPEARQNRNQAEINRLAELEKIEAYNQEVAEKPAIEAEPVEDQAAEPENVEPAPQEESQIDPGQQAFVDNKIQELGSIEAVEKFYPGDDTVSEYARGKANEVFETSGDTEKFVHDHTNTQVAVTGQEATEIKNFAAKIPDEELYIDESDDSYGREDEPHITVKYGLKTNDPGDVQSILKDHPQVSAKMGGVSIFENEKYDVVKVEIDSPELHALNEKINKEAEISLPKGETFDYTPHATIAYVKPGEGKKYVGDKSFEGRDIIFDAITVSTRDGKQHQIKLSGVGQKQTIPENNTPPVSEPSAPSGVTSNDIQADLGKPIEDFGEKIGGARKDYAAKLSIASDLATAQNPLSKTFPEPNYKKLVDSGVDPHLVGMVRAMRDEIPNKPRKAWTLKQWAKQVEILRDFASSLLDGSVSIDKLKSGIKNKQETLFGPIDGRGELYSIFGHDKSLKGIKMEKVHWSVYKGKKNVTKWQISRSGAKSAWSNMPDILGEGGTKEEAIASFKTRYDSLSGNKKQNKTKFEIYQYRANPGTHWIGKKVGRDYIDLKSFGSSPEARAYLADNYDSLVSELKKHKYIPDVRRKENEERIGEDHRGGKDITPEKFTEAFGFRGVEFGNWVGKKNERQNALNNAYDAFFDLASILNIPTQALSLNGELGLAFGSRGHGGKRAAAAHYEPGKVVINLTRKQGAGSLAHEWWHSLDNYFSRLREQPGRYLSEHPYKRTTNPDIEIRQEMIDAFKAIQRAYSATEIKKRSARLDKKRTKAYWSTKREITARIFETFVISELAEKGYSNDYLANIVSSNEFTTDLLDNMGDPNFQAMDYYPYLTDSEAVGVHKAFSEFFKTIKTKTTDKGVVLYQSSRKDGKIKPKEISNGRPLAQKRVAPEHSKQDGKTIRREDAERHFHNLFGHLDKSGETRLTQTETKEHRQLEKIAAVFGKELYFWETKHPELKNAGGFTDPTSGNEIFINANAKDPLISIVGHELIHQLKHNHSDLYEFLENTIRTSDSGFKEYVEAFHKSRQDDFSKVTSPEKVYEEFIGDFASDQFHRVEFWSKLAGQNRSFTQKIVDVLQAILDKIKRLFPRAEQYVTNFKESQDALAKAMGEAIKRDKGLKPASKSDTKFQVTSKKGKGDISTESNPDMPDGGNPFKNSQVQESVYHGSPTEGIQTFRGETTGDAIFFTESKEYASHYGQQEYEAYINLENPIWMGDVDANWSYTPNQWIDFFKGEFGVELPVDGIEDFDSEIEFWRILKESDNGQQFIDNAREAGYDGWTIEEEGHMTHVVFSSEQIKMIEKDFNHSGEWDQETLDAFYSNPKQSRTPDDGVQNSLLFQMQREAFTPEGQHAFKGIAQTAPTPQDYIENRRQHKDIKLKAKTSLRKLTRDVAKGVDKFLGSISTRLKAISPKLAAKVRTLDFDTNTKAASDLKIALPLLKKAKHMTRDDYADWDYARKNSDKKKLDELNRKYGMEKEYKAVRNMLDRIREEAIDVGYEVGEIEEYWPRVLKDQEGFLQAIDRGPERPEFTDALKKKAKDMGIEVWEMDPTLRADIISNVILGKYYGIPGPGSVKQRVFRKIPAEFNKFYMNSDAALTNHIHSMRKRIEARRFFGKVPDRIATAKQRLRTAEARLRRIDGTDDREKINEVKDRIEQYKIIIEKYKHQSDFEENIGSYIGELIAQREITPSDEKVVKEVLTSRFNEHGTRGVVNAYKNLSYIDTMGSFTSAITQVGDLAWAAYEGGLIPTLKYAYKASRGKSRITKESVGVERIAQEFSDGDTLSKAVSKVFKFVGLEKMDSIGKESLLNVALEKYQKQAKKNPALLKTKIKPIFEQETDSVIQDLLNDEITENVKLLVYHRLLDFQPVALSEMPEKYLTAGNGRIFYMLKTFTIKQFDVYRKEVYTKLKHGDKTEKIQAMKNLISLTAMFVLANAGADELKDLLLGRSTDLEDRVVDNLLRLFGVSKFVTWKARTEGVGSAMARQILPPFKFIDAATKDIMTAGDGKGVYTIGSVPVVGKLAYWHMGRGKRSKGDRWDRMLLKEKRRLNKIKDRLDVSKNKSNFMAEHRDDFRKLARIKRLQGKLNKYRRLINRLKSGDQTSQISKRIEVLEEKRTALVMKYFGRGAK